MVPFKDIYCSRDDDWPGMVIVLGMANVKGKATVIGRMTALGMVTIVVLVAVLGTLLFLKRMNVLVMVRAAIGSCKRFRELFLMFISKIWDDHTDRQYRIHSCSVAKKRASHYNFNSYYFALNHITHTDSL